jgi:cytochrome c oxidase cbb3-type subunit III
MRHHERHPAVRALTLLAAAAVSLLLVSGCERERRGFRDSPAGTAALTRVRQSGLQPGPRTAEAAVESPYDGNAYAASEGKRLYNQYNCSGCHFQGGGGIGPPLMDAEWIYGSEPDNIFATIVEGRPNGMPSFRHRIPDQQIWLLVAYVRSMSGLLAKDVAPGRSDDMQVNAQEQQTIKQHPVNSTVPKSAERP